MTLVAPDPTRAVPLPLREQAAVRDRWLTQRLLDVLPGLMDRAGIDLWLVVGREYNEDPVLRHPAAGDLAVGPAADDPRPAPQ